MRKSYFKILIFIFVIGVSRSYAQVSKNLEIIDFISLIDTTGGTHGTEIWGFVDSSGNEIAILGKKRTGIKDTSVANIGFEILTML